MIKELFRLQELYIFLDVAIASMLTMFVGLEREKAAKAAGLRTNMIVGGFTCLMVSLSRPLIDFLGEGYKDMIDTDPIRIFQAIVIGVSFIGAGAILKGEKETKIRGLTTAATLLYSSGIGVCTAMKMYLLATLLTVSILIINYAIRKIT